MTFKFHFDYSFIPKSITASVLMSIIIVLDKPEGAINVLFIIILSVAVYVTLILLMRGINGKEIEFLKSMIK